MGIGTLATDYVGDGNKAERSTGLDGAVDSFELTISLWFLIPFGSSGTQFFYSRIRSGLPGVDSISFDTSNNSVNILMHNDLAPTESNPLKDIVLDMSSTSGITLGVWHHLLASWRKGLGFAGQPAFRLFIDDVNSLGELGPGNKNQGVIDHTTAPHTIAGSDSTSFEYSGCLSEFYFNPDVFLDFTLSLSDRRLFIDGSGNPVELGSDGSDPTGTAPIIYLPDGAATTNAGTGGDFVQQGSVAVCPTIPGLLPSLTPRDIIEQVKNEIDAAGIAETDDFLRLRLGFSETFLCDALSKFDAGDLRKTAKGVRKAVKFLELAVEKGFDAATITDWGDRLCGAIRTIASDEIDAAIARTGDPVKIAEAQDVFADGELEKLFSEFLAAINDFEKAIKSATVA